MTSDDRTGRKWRGVWCCRFADGVLCGPLVDEGPIPEGKRANDRPWTVRIEKDGIRITVIATARRWYRPGKLAGTTPVMATTLVESDDEKGDQP